MNQPTTRIATDDAVINGLIKTARTKEGLDSMLVDDLQALANHFGIGVDFNSPGTPDLTWQNAVGEIRQAVNAPAR